MSNKLQLEAQKLLTQADIEINGSRPWDIKVHDKRLFQRALSDGSLGFGEAYMDNWWDCEQIDTMISKLMAAKLADKIKPNLKLILIYLKAKLINLQKKARAFSIGHEHYDLGNDLYSHMLDKRLVYTCAYWENATNLDDAQEAKLDLVCRKLNLQPGQRILDIGCGWGSFAAFAAQKYGVQVVGVTVSKEQVLLGNELCKGLNVDFRLQDYRDLAHGKEKFDHIVSLGMFEHVGYKNYRLFMEIANKCLKDEGLFLLHTIGSNISNTTSDPWIGRYIFPNSMLPSVAQIGSSIENLFVMEDWHNFSAHYDKTLLAWYKNFETNWAKIEHQYDNRFYRMWKYYLLSCAGSFRSRHNQLWQVVLSKSGVANGYKSLR